MRLAPDEKRGPYNSEMEDTNKYGLEYILF